MEGYTAVEVVEYILLVTFALLLVFFGGLTEKQVNQLKADDLSLSFDSVFLLDNDVTVMHDLGKQFSVEIINDRFHIYQNSNEYSGISGLSINSDYVPVDQLKGKTRNIKIEKKGKKVVVS